MEKPIGPPNIKVKDNSNFGVLFLFSILLLLFVAGASTCKVSDWEVNPYKSKAECMIKILDSLEHKATPEEISNIESYCEKYDR